MAEVIGEVWMEDRAEQNLRLLLEEGLPADWLVYPQFRTCDSRGAFGSETRDRTMDFLVVGRRTVFVLETKDWSGRWAGDENFWSRSTSGQGEPERRRSPIAQASSYVGFVRGHLQSVLPGVDLPWICGLVVLCGSTRKEDLDVDDPTLRDRVFNSEDICQVLLRKDQGSEKSLPPEARQRLVEKLRKHAPNPKAPDPGLQASLDETWRILKEDAGYYCPRHDLKELLDQHRALVEGGWLVITGPPGVGKSTLAAAAAEELSREPDHHVIPLRLGAEESADRMVQILLHELQRQGEFRLPTSLLQQSTKNPDILAEAMHRYMARDKNRQSKGPSFLLSPLSSIRRPGLTLLLDGLDEMEEPERLLGVLPRSLPPGVRMLLFSRAIPLLDEFIDEVRSDVKRRTVDLLLPEEAAGILERHHELRPGGDRTRQILRMAQGHPMLLRILGEAAPVGPLPEVATYPEERLESYLRRIVNQVVQGRAESAGPRPGRALREKVLRVILESRSPLPKRALAEILHVLDPRIHPSEVDEALQCLKPLLQIRPARSLAPSGYQVFHRQVEDLLRGDLLPNTDPSLLQQIHSGFCQWLKSGSQACQDYALLHHPEHLWRAGHRFEAIDLLCTPDFLVRRHSRGLFPQTLSEVRDFERRLEVPENQETRRWQAIEEFSAGLAAWANHVRHAVSQGSSPWEAAATAPPIPFPDSRTVLLPAGRTRGKPESSGGRRSRRPGRPARRDQAQEARTRLGRLARSLGRFAPYQDVKGLNLADFLADFCADPVAKRQSGGLRQSGLRLDWSWPEASAELDPAQPVSIPVGSRIANIAVTPDGRRAVVLTSSKGLILFDLDSGEIQARTALPEASDSESKVSGPQFVSMCIAADAGRVLARWISTATVFQWAAGQPFQQLWTGEIPRGSRLEMDESGTLLMTDSPDALEGLPPGIEQVHIPESGRYGDSICLRVPFQPGRIVLVQENESGGVLGGRSEMTVSEFHLAEKWKVRESSSFSLKGEGESRVGCVHQGETTILLARKGDATFLIRRGKGNADRMIPCPELTRGVRCLGISGDERHCVVVGDGGLDMCGAVELWALPRMERLARRTIDSDDRLESVGRHGLAIDAGRIVSDFQSLLFVYDLPALLNAQTPGLHPSPDFVEPDAGCFLTLLPDASQQAPAVVVPELRQVHPLQLEERGRTLLLMNRWRARLAYHPASACLAVIQGADRSDVHDSVPGSGGLEGDSGEEPDEEVSRVLIYQFPEMVVLGGSILTGHCRSLRHHPTEARFLVTVVRTSPDTTMKWLEISLDHQGRELGMRPILSVEDSESLWWVDSGFDFDLLIRTREGASWDQVDQEFLARFRDGSEWTVARWVCPPHSESQPTLAEDGRVLFAESTGHLLEVDVPGRAILSQELVVGASYRTGRLHPTRHQAALLRVEGILELRDLEEQKTLALFTAGEEIVEVGDFLSDGCLTCRTLSGRVLVLRPE